MAFYAKEDVVVPRVDEYAVYKNSDGDIVINQSADGADLFVSIPKDNVSAIAKRMLELSREGEMSFSPQPQPEPQMQQRPQPQPIITVRRKK